MIRQNISFDVTADKEVMLLSEEKMCLDSRIRSASFGIDWSQVTAFFHPDLQHSLFVIVAQAEQDLPGNCNIRQSISR